MVCCHLLAASRSALRDGWCHGFRSTIVLRFGSWSESGVFCACSVVGKIAVLRHTLLCPHLWTCVLSCVCGEYNLTDLHLWGKESSSWSVPAVILIVMLWGYFKKNAQHEQLCSCHSHLRHIWSRKQSTSCSLSRLKKRILGMHIKNIN